MRRKFIDALNSSRLTHKFLKSPSPQWLIYIFDIIVVLLSAWLTISFNDDATAGLPGLIYSTPVKVLSITLVYALVMLAVCPYKSIVRLSAFEDTYRVALTVILASLVMFFLENVVHWTNSPRFVGTWSIFITGVIAFSIMVSMRLMVKYLYRIATSEDADTRKRVVVLGSSVNSFALAQALLTEANGRYIPVLLLSINGGNDGGRINGIPVRHYSPDTVAKIFEEYDSQTLIFLSDQIEFMQGGEADVFLENNIKLLKLNQIEEFDVTGVGDSAPTLSTHVQDFHIEDLLGRDPIVTNNTAIDSALRDRTVLITGAAGSIGSEIVRQVARRRPGRIVLVDQAETPMHELQLEMEKDYPEVTIMLCIADVANRPRMTDIFDRYRPQIVYHAAAYKHVPMMERNPQEAVLTNVFGTKNIADLSLQFGIEKFVMISTDKAVNPTNIMGASKRIAEIYVQSLAMSLRGNINAKKTAFITTRFGNVLGSNGSVIPLFRKQIAAGGPVTVTHRDIIRYFMTIPEACSLVLEAGCMGTGGEIFIFDMGKPVRIYDMAKRMISLAGLRPHVDIQIVETGLRPGEKLFEELLNDHEHTIATHHKKIMIAKVRTYDYAEVCARLSDLNEMLKQYNIHDIVTQMKLLVPEFKSQNSSFKAIDDEIDDHNVIHEIV